MKKILSLTLALIMVMSALFCFASCGEKDDNTLVCGVTIFENMNEKDENGEWTGFDTEFALLVGKKLGVEVEFVEIDWAQKQPAGCGGLRSTYPAAWGSGGRYCGA